MNDPSIYPTTQRHMDQRWYYSNNANVYYTKNSATAMKTAIQDPPAYGYSDSYWNYPVDYGGDYGYFPMGSAVRMRNSEGVKVSPQKEAPPPPSPKVLSWDLFNPFVAFDGGYAGYYPIGTYGYGSNSTSPDLSEVRKREGIPDLEEETENELHKEALKGKRMNAEAKKRSRTEPIQNNIESSSKSVPQSSEERLKPSVSPHNEGYSWSKSVDEGSVKKKGVNTEVDSSRLSSVTVLSPRGTRDLKEVVAEIRDDFEIASGYGREVALMLEVEKMPYRPGFLRVILSRILYLITPLLKLRGSSSMQSVKSASTSKKSAKSYFEDVGKDVNATVYNLSSTLDKLYAWEKKLHKEDEERIRIKYEKQYKRLKVLDEEGAESSKIYAAQTSIRRLRTKLDVSIKAIDVISSRIDKLRDEELQPKVAALIHGLIRMWKAMLKCHQKQFRAIMEIKTQKLRVKTCLQTDSSLRTTTELENELRSWCHRFNEWIGFQKSYVESLNGWLLKCLQFEPEQEFSDRPFFYSPSQLGAPSIFIICNDWHKALESISEGKVAKPLNAFASSLHQLWEKQDNEEHQAEYLLMDYEKLLRTRRMEKMERGQDSSLSPLNLDSLRQRLVEERRKHKDSMKLVHNAASSSLRGGLVPIFKALENFTSEALKAHEHVRIQHPMVELTKRK
ncbi:hypothetical protein DH2020_035166 [Rehmannia glutinosa]|uniref:DUF632 domain-containing protein n=1 Tax=Rehmannia glutinosa TaxID=99300 RepID=A0ABR0V7F2_REHGL